ncbi:hypothetical protein OG599_26745 [Streptomyces sp. NBC_01335]|uniref:hypothetical protein n=1 Tax=Streptomyces sp. NBC_01335 TaxID=2903828 RepID=UPI002E11E267|nr:hypothetical protein OG599_26745 [Streptomyces sp. NBC_01335]
MEQSIDAKTKSEFAAGTDPAYIPGLTAPVPVRTGDEEEAGTSAEAAADDAGIQDAVPAEPSATTAEGVDEEPEDATGESAASGDGDAPAGASADADADASGADADESGAPVFEISDRRGSIRVGKEGIRFTLDDQQADFDWSEVSAVEVKTAGMARRFTLTVHVSSRRWFNAEVVAESRKRLKEWPEELDVVLDAYFEESEES